MKKVAISLRVSSKDGRQTTENQLLQLKEFCHKKNWEIYDIYTDYEKGSKGRTGRKDFNRMFEDAYKRKFDIVLVWAMDRFTREGMFETVAYIKKLDNYGIIFWSYTEEMVNTEDETMRGVAIAWLSSIAKVELKKLSARTIAGLERVRKEGQLFGPKPLWEREKYAGIDVKIDKMLKQNITPYMIAKKCKIHINTVKQYTREQNPELKTRIINLYLEKTKENEIAKELKISIRKVRQVILLAKDHGTI